MSGASSPAEVALAQGGRTELGAIAIADGVVSKIAARAAIENPDAGAAATRVMGILVPGAGHLGVRGTDLNALPKTSVAVDGSSAFVDLELSVRWPANIAQVTAQVRDRVIERVHALTGITVEEVHITVAALATDIAAPSRVR